MTLFTYDKRGRRTGPRHELPGAVWAAVSVLVVLALGWAGTLPPAVRLVVAIACIAVAVAVVRSTR